MVVVIPSSTHDVAEYDAATGSEGCRRPRGRDEMQRAQSYHSRPAAVNACSWHFTGGAVAYLAAQWLGQLRLRSGILPTQCAQCSCETRTLSASKTAKCHAAGSPEPVE